MSQIIKVGMADYKICKSPDSILTLGLGSCVGIVLYDRTTKYAGLAHIMLPDSTKIRDNSNRAKFADTCIGDMLNDLLARGVSKSCLVAKIAGGAQMFSFASSNELTCVGERNVEATRLQLERLRIPIVADDTGLNFGRTIEFFPESGMLHIRAVGKAERAI